MVNRILSPLQTDFKRVVNYSRLITNYYSIYDPILLYSENFSFIRGTVVEAGPVTVITFIGLVSVSMSKDYVIYCVEILF